MLICKTDLLKKVALRTTSSIAIIAGALMSSHSAFAQTATPDGASGNVEQVVVTGSRVVRDGYQAPTPVTVLDKDTLDAMGAINIADSVNQLPQLAQSVSPIDQPAGYGGGSIGVNELDLRSLGVNRTLVLIDGKRFVNSSDTPAFAAPDINTIPNALISRVDIVTGGASAAYGSDALTGVVNFVLDRDFTGVKAEAEGGLSTYGDDAQYKAALTFGTGFGPGSRGHFLLSGELTNDNGIVGNYRPWNANSAAVMTNPNYTSTNGLPFFLVARQVGLSNGTPGGLITSGPLQGIAFGPGGTPTIFHYGLVSTNNVMSGGDWQYSRIDNNVSIDPRLLRENVFSRASYDIFDNVQLYGEFQWSRTDANTRSIPNRALGNGVTVLAGNPFIPATIATEMAALNLSSFSVGTTNGDIGLVEAVNRRTLTRGDVGASGQFSLFGTDWKWDAYYQYSESQNLSEATNDFNRANYALAANAVRNPANGAIVCASTLSNPGNGCVPYDVMGTGVNSQAAINYVTGTSLENETLSQGDFAANFNGEPFSTWAGPVSTAFGIENRREGATGQATALDLANAYGLGDYHPTIGAYTVTEGFVETVVPLAKDLSWAKSLDLNAAARETGYTTSGDATTWKVGVTYAPSDDVRLRGTRSRDIRAPDLGELFAQGQTALGAPLFDPFTNTHLPAVIQLASGNAQLKPEVADTTEGGVVVSPSFLPGFQASVDYYNINITNAVQTPNTQSVVNLCYQGIAALCSDVQRTAGVISLVVTSPTNISSQKTDGFDMEVTYRFALSDVWRGVDGNVTFHALGNYVSSMTSLDPTTGIVTQGAGVLGGRFGAYGSTVNTGPSVPKFQSTVFLNYDADLWSAQLMMRYVGAGVYNNSFASCASGCPIGDQRSINNNYIPSNTVFGLSATYRPFANPGTNVYLAIDNIFNDAPPIIGGTTINAYYEGQANSDYYDRIGRMFRLGVRFQT
jgi:iron complex outermembrane receptor protein